MQMSIFGGYVYYDRINCLRVKKVTAPRSVPEENEAREDKRDDTDTFISKLTRYAYNQANHDETMQLREKSFLSALPLNLLYLFVRLSQIENFSLLRPIGVCNF
jgi:hypothetical protein